MIIFLKLSFHFFLLLLFFWFWKRKCDQWTIENKIHTMYIVYTNLNGCNAKERIREMYKIYVPMPFSSSHTYVWCVYGSGSVLFWILIWVFCFCSWWEPWKHNRKREKQNQNQHQIIENVGWRRISFMTDFPIPTIHVLMHNEYLLLFYLAIRK